MHRKSTLLESRSNFSHDDDRLERELKNKIDEDYGKKSRK
jgi:hypothetical protein